MSINLTPVDLTGAVAGKSGPLDWTGVIQSGTPIGTKAGHATLRLFNESNCGLQLNLSGVQGTSLPAGGWGDIPLSGQNSLQYTVLYVLAGPSPNTLIGVIYEPGEKVPPLPVLGNSAVGVGGVVNTSTSSALKNDGNGPGLQIIESTPSDQVASSLGVNNDGSGFWKILSAGVLRIVLNIVRGNSGAGKASIQFGDSGDTSITTFYGTVGSGSVVPGATVSGDIAANQVGPGALDTDVTMLAGEVQPGNFPLGQFTFTAVAAAGGATQFFSGNNSANHGDMMNWINGNDNTCSLGWGLGDFSFSPFGFGIYLYDFKNAAVVAQGISSERTVTGRGPLAQFSTAGGGNCGNRCWEGTTDPAGNAGEGDLWYSA